MKKNILIVLFLVSASLFAQGEMKFAAKIANRKNDSLIIKSQAGVLKVLKSDAKGNFKAASFPVKPDFYQVTDGTGVAVLYLKEGNDLTMTYDANDLLGTAVFKGKGEKENNILAHFNKNNKELGLRLAAITDAATRNKMIDELLAGMQKQLEDATLDANFRTVINGQVTQQRQQLAQQMEKGERLAKIIGQPSPLFNYENFKGGTTSLESLKGKYVYIDVWAQWCGPCRQEIPHLQKLEQDYHGKKIEFVSISIDEKKNYDKWRKMVEDKQMSGIQLIADNAWKSEFVQAFGINSIPRFLLIGPDGKVLEADAARPSNPALRTQLDELLK